MGHYPFSLSHKSVRPHKKIYPSLSAGLVGAMVMDGTLWRILHSRVLRSVCVSRVAMIFRAWALVLGQPGSCPLLRLDEPPRPGCLLAIYCLCCSVAFLLPVISGLMAVPLKNPWDPRLRTGLEGLLSSIPLGLDLLYREECRPPPPALPRLMPEVLLLSFTSIHGSGVASLCRESACSRRFVSPQLTDTPWLTFLNVFIEKD